MELRDRIATAMKAAGMSQADLCRATQMGSSKVSQLLKGKVEDPRLSTAIKIADALGVSLDYLAGRSSPPPPPAYADARQRRMNEAFEQMDDDGRDMATASVVAIRDAKRARGESAVQADVSEAV